MDEIFQDKTEECLKFDIYADPDQCDDSTALDTVVDCDSNPASTIAAAEILLRRLLHVIADMRTVVSKVLILIINDHPLLLFTLIQIVLYSISTFELFVALIPVRHMFRLPLYNHLVWAHWHRKALVSTQSILHWWSSQAQR